MSGREKIQFYSIVINTFVKLNSLFPRTLNHWFYKHSRNLKGNFGKLVRFVLLKNLCATCGSNVSIHENVFMTGFQNLHIGENVSIHPMCYIDATGSIFIGDNVSIAHSSTILSSEHTWFDSDLPIKYNKLILKKTIISEDVWIGCGVRILAGTLINKHAIIAAGAVVKMEVPTNVIVGGIPAKIIKRI